MTHLRELIRRLFLPKVMTAVLLLCAALAIIGIWAIGAMPLDAIPDVSERQVIVYAQWNGQDPQVI